MCTRAPSATRTECFQSSQVQLNSPFTAAADRPLQLTLDQATSNTYQKLAKSNTYVQPGDVAPNGYGPAGTVMVTVTGKVSVSVETTVVVTGTVTGCVIV